MIQYRLLFGTLCTAFFIASVHDVHGQCTNTALYPSNFVTPISSGQVTTISGCSWQTEYSHIIDVIAGVDYEFTISDTSFITVHQGTFDGPVLGFGQSPLTISTTTNEDLFPHWNTDSNCGGAQNCLTTTVQLILDCTAPLAAVAPVLIDCESGQFTLNVSVSSLGSSANLEIANNAGVASTFTSAPGTFALGPFPIDVPVALTLVHDQNPLCNVPLGSFVNSPCIIPVECSNPLSESYCYVDFDAHFWLYQNTGTEPLAIIFSAGSIENVAYDHLAIYDGVDNTAPLLWAHTSSGSFDLTGLVTVSTGSAIYMEMTSDVSIACGSGQAEWFWTVGCLDCALPVAAFTLVEDCQHNAYNIAVNVTNTGSAQDVRLVNSWSNDTLNAVGLGTTSVGPIPVGQTAHVSVLNGENELCRITSPDFFLPVNACVITACESIGVEYCYANADTAWFIYQSGTNIPVTISFAYGQLLPNDNILLYNGLNTSAQLVYLGNQNGQIGGLALSSNNTDNALTLKVASNGSGSCATGEATQQIYWTVGCGLVGEAERSTDEFAVFPNPTSGELFIRPSEMINGSVLLEVFDVAGRSVMKEQFNAISGSNFTADLGGLMNGHYSIRISSLEGFFEETIQIVR
ncbi:MAG: T9SS type A sorting domain-containing protein [Flavobacteriales bacterium]|nr:T9SS type A sorting domain-containing protein [Flavobacteriales bacterium]